MSSAARVRQVVDTSQCGHTAAWDGRPPLLLVMHARLVSCVHVQVITSLAAVAAFALIALPALVYYTGWFGLVKYWLMPWLGYHFW